MARIDAFLKLGTQQGCSDIHLAVGIPPMLLLGFSIVRSEHEQIWNMSSFAFGMILIASGFVAYLVNHALKPAGWAVHEEKPQPTS